MSHQNKSFIELGPWVRRISYLESAGLDEARQLIVPDHAQLHKCTFLRLPKIIQTDLDSPSSKKSKLALKLAHQSLDLGETKLNQTSTKTRYGALNGSVLHLSKQKGGATARKSLQLPNHLRQTIAASLDRKVSKVQMGDAVVAHHLMRGSKRILMNQQSAKKRSLMLFIRQLNLDKDLMRSYLQYKGREQLIPELSVPKAYPCSIESIP